MNKKLNKVFFSKKTDEYETPQDLFNKLNKKYNFTLDPCATEMNHKCNKYYTIKDNGLIQSWKNETVFVNPPFSKNKEWCEKCMNEWLYNNTKIVLLIPARTDTKYFHKYVLPYCDITFIKGRLHFNNSKYGAPFPVIICEYKKY